MSAFAPAVLFGAFDRHNFGDLLFAHVLARMLAPREPLFAGLASRDLRRYGGHEVRAITGIGAIANCADPFDLIHAGGELLTCNAWEAAVMLAPPERVQSVIDEESAWRDDPLAWSQRYFGMAARAPYVLSKSTLPALRPLRVVFHAMGGAGLNRCEQRFQQEVIDKLPLADHLTVRDKETQAQLLAHGVQAPLVPDPAVMVADLFGTFIRKRAAQGPLKAIKSAFRQGYIAVQFDATFSDDAALDTLARELSRVAQEWKLGIVMFCAGIAPWHDDPDVYARLKARLTTQCTLFTSLDIWDICALIASSCAWCGSGLHGRIVAMAFARPRVNIVHREGVLQPPKHAAFAATWEPEEVIATAYGEELAHAMSAALQTDAALLRDTADDLVHRYRSAFMKSGPSVPER